MLSFLVLFLLLLNLVVHLIYLKLIRNSCVTGFWESLSCDNSSLIVSWYTPYANMADHSDSTRDESNESEASQALMFCFYNAFSDKSCFVVDLVPLFRPPYVFLCS